MHTVMVVSAGLVTLAVFCVTGRLTGGNPGLRRAFRWFLPVWLVAALVNLTIGVVSAGYTVAQELPILLVTFGVPAVVGLLAIRLFAKV